MNSLYYESHITIEPVFDERLNRFKEICELYDFRVADLLMQKRKDDTPEKSKYDSFCTARDSSFDLLKQKMMAVLTKLRFVKRGQSQGIALILEKPVAP